MKRERIQKDRKPPPKDEEEPQDLPQLTDRIKKAREHIAEARRAIDKALEGES